MKNFFYKKVFYYHYQLPDKPTKLFFKKVFLWRTLIQTPNASKNARIVIYFLIDIL